MMNAGQLVVRRPGLPPFCNTFRAAAVEYLEAAGIQQGGPADASAGLSKVEGTWHGQARTWAWNPLYSQWQLLHILRSGDTLWKMGNTYYGQSSLQNVHRIGDVEQNAPIIGANATGDEAYALGVEGDVLLIPDLEQPYGQPPAPPPNGAVPDPDGAQPPEIPDWGERPPNYPPDWPWPPGWATPPVEPPAEPAPDEPGPAEPTPIGARTGIARRESWWTPGKILLVGGLGVSTVALIIWGVVSAGKPKRRKRPKRKSSKRRRR